MNLATLLFWIFFLMGLLPLLMTISILKKWSKAQSWHKTEGLIIDSHIEKSYSGSDTLYQYEPSIKYTYRVDDTDFVHTQIHFRFMGNYNEVMAMNMVKRFPTGETAQIYYDPKAPQTSVLDITLDVPALIIQIIGIAIAWGLASLSYLNI